MAQALERKWPSASAGGQAREWLWELVEGMFETAVEPGSGPDAAVGAGVEGGNAVLETAVGSSTAFWVVEGVSRCICRCCGSVLGCEQAVAPIANISKA